MGTNGKEKVSRKSRNWISEKRTTQRKIPEISRSQMERKFPVRSFRKFGIPRKVVLFSTNSWKCFSIRHWKFPKIQIGMKSAPNSACRFRLLKKHFGSNGSSIPIFPNFIVTIVITTTGLSTTPFQYWCLIISVIFVPPFHLTLLIEYFYLWRSFAV